LVCQTNVLSPLSTFCIATGDDNHCTVQVALEKKVLRTICGPIQDNCVYRRRYIFELERDFNNQCVINVLKTIRRQSEDPKTYHSWQETWWQGRPKSEWADGVHSDSRALEAPDWTNREREPDK
jgi:hypothetical protein